ncbi:DUF3618 domain-containing protein [Streptomyces sp. NPDC052109]|uniref:DUF3618 domain-containing protein n=1 Tax=Streptomyces sp. NPDC052109 TaxID=3155527 RepID=UPI003437E706
MEQTREELGQTVEALAAKTDVKARAQEKATAVKEQAAVKAGELKAKAAHLAHQVQDKLPDPVKGKAAQAGQLWQDKAPESVQQRTAQGARMARENRNLLLAAAGVAVVAWMVCRRRKG